jgi:hypothetical protein
LKTELIKGNNSMKKSIILMAVLASLSQVSNAQGFLQKLQDKANKAAAGGGAGGKGSGNGIASMCPGHTPYKKKDLAGSTPEQLVGKYFKMSADIEKLLIDGIAVQRPGTMPNFDRAVDDIKDKEIKKLGQAFIANPSVSVLSQVIAYAERGDGYIAEREPAEIAEAQALLAMVMMQYPNLAINKDYVLVLLKQAESKNSGLAKALTARAHLFGDYAPKNIGAFSNYIAGASRDYQVKLGEQTIFYALDKIPDWKMRQQYLDLIRMSQQMQQSYQRQQNAAKSSDTNRRAIELMREGEKIDQLTLEAIGAGPKISELRAKGELLRKEGKGEANLIEVEASQSVEYQREVARLLAANPQMTDDAKAKLEKANKLKVDNLTALRGLSLEVALKFFSGDVGSIAESGTYITRYYYNSCNVAIRQLEFSKQVGVPQPAVNEAQLAKDNL